MVSGHPFTLEFANLACRFCTANGQSAGCLTFSCYFYLQCQGLSVTISLTYWTTENSIIRVEVSDCFPSLGLIPRTAKGSRLYCFCCLEGLLVSFYSCLLSVLLCSTLLFYSKLGILISTHTLAYLCQFILCM